MNYSRQRELIHEYLKLRHDHPTADMIYSELKKDNPRLSLGTVYRNLSQLADNHEIGCFAGSDGTLHYDPVAVPHYHFECRCCGAYIDIPMEHIPDSADKLLDEMASRTGVGTIDHHDIIFRGICSKCSQKLS